jgi:dienelactone hydrolase
MNALTRRMLSGVAGLAGMTWLGLVAALAARQQQLVFNPIRNKEVDRPRSAAHRTRAVVLRSSDGTRLCGWLLTPNAPGPHPGVIYFGGRSEEVSWAARDAGTMFPGVAALIVNYRGYGDSHGFPGERQMIEDGEMLHNWLASHRHIDPARMAVVGRSLGSGVAVQLAARKPVAALALITPYDSILAIARRRFRSMPVALILRHRFESIKHAASVRAPVLVIRAERDEVVPRMHTDSLIAKFTAPVCDKTIAGSDHCNIPYAPDTQALLARFLREKLFSTRMGSNSVGIRRQEPTGRPGTFRPAGERIDAAT